LGGGRSSALALVTPCPLPCMQTDPGMSLKGPSLPAPPPAPAAPLLESDPGMSLKGPSSAKVLGPVPVPEPPVQFLASASSSALPPVPPENSKRKRRRDSRETRDRSTSPVLRRLPWMRTPLPDRPTTTVPDPDSDTSGGEGPWDIFLPDFPGPSCFSFCSSPLLCGS